MLSPSKLAVYVLTATVITINDTAMLASVWVYITSLTPFVTAYNIH